MTARGGDAQASPGIRYAPSRGFPAYAFLPGRDPHPSRDPRGHSYGVPEPAIDYAPPENWRANGVYLFGVDLYNHGYLWEAHEAWEGAWHASKRDPLQADFLQGLIQLSAAALKIAMEQPNGLARLTELGATKLDSVAARAGSRYMGLPVVEFARRFREFASSSPTSAEGRPRIALELESR